MFLDTMDLGTQYRDSVLARMEKNYQLFSFYNTIEMLAMSKFEYKNLPDGVFTELIERPFLRSGMCAMKEIIDSEDSTERMYSGIPIISGVTMNYNIPRYAQLVTPCGQTTTLLVGKDIPLGYNNYNHTPEFDIMKYAKIFSEIDTSLDIAIKNTRMTKVFVVSDSKKAESINNIMNDIYNGKPKAVSLNTTFEDMLDTGGDGKRTPDIQLTDPRDVETLQYLSKLHDDLVRRLATLHGHKMNTSGKMAQMTRDELNESETFSHIYVCQQMELRKRYVEDCNRILGTNIAVDYGCAWQHFKAGETTTEEFIKEVSESEDDEENEKRKQSNTEPNQIQE